MPQPTDPRRLELLRAAVRRRLRSSTAGQHDLDAADLASVEEELVSLLDDAWSDRAWTDGAGSDGADHDRPPELDAWVQRQLHDLEIHRPRPTNARTLPEMPAMTAPSTPARRFGPLEMLRTFGHDLRFGLRMLAKKPLFTVIAVLTLGVGVGVDAAVFGLVDAILFRPATAAEPGELVSIYQAPPDDLEHQPLSYPNWADLAAQTETLESFDAYALAVVAFDAGTADATSRMAVITQVTPGYFATTGLPPAVGRLLGPDDDGEPVAVVGHDTWQRHFGGDPQVVGRTIRLNGDPYSVVGVAPEGFQGYFRGLAPEAWITVRSGASSRAGSLSSTGGRNDDLPLLEDRTFRWLWTVGRRADGIEVDAVRAEMTTLAAGLRAVHPELDERYAYAVLRTNDVRMLPDFDGSLRIAGWLALALVGLVLLIACANLANMLMARAIGRRKEMATRLALGAGRGRLVRQLLAECLLLALAGGAVGVLVARAGLGLLARPDLPFPVPLEFGVALDHRVALYVVGISLATTVLFGLSPALASLRLDLSGTLRAEGRGGGGRRKGKLRVALVVGQVALSFVLLVAAGLMLRSLEASRDADPGFDAAGVVVGTFAPTFQGVEDEQIGPFYDRLVEGLRARPGVVGVAEINQLPLGVESRSEPLIRWQDRALDEDLWTVAQMATASEGYFDVVRIPLLSGRTFSALDVPPTTPEVRGEVRGEAPASLDSGRPAERSLSVVINQTLAASLWPGEEAVGQSLKLRGRELPATVIGVVGDGKYRSLSEPPTPFLWFSMEQLPEGRRRVLVRHEGDAAAVLGAVRRTARGVDERVDPIDLTTLEQTVARSLFVPRTGSRLLGVLGLLGLALASVGLYGVVAQAVASRRHEMGVRMALGADRGSILGLVLRDGLLLVAIGSAVGLAGALAVGRGLSSFLYGVGAFDPATLLAVPTVLAVVALLACWWPAHRAARVDPSSALRAE